jgi:hypothetical protein
MAEPEWSAALRRVAQHWTDPDYTPRQMAVERTLAAENHFTEESLAFVVNHGADFVARGGVDRWIGAEAPRTTLTVGVVSRGRTPFEGFFEAAAASLVADRVLVSLAPSSPTLLERFFDDVAAEAGERQRVRIVGESDVIQKADAVIATGTASEMAAWSDQLDVSNVPQDSRLLQAVRLGVAVLDGTEDRAALSGLAEDLLLHEGGTPQSVRVIFAPSGHSPDGVLAAMAGFREVFPPHDLTSGKLALRVAYLEALGMSLAVGPGFLVTRGEFEVQADAHIRWVEYDALDDVAARLAACSPGEMFLSTGEPLAAGLRARMGPETPILGFGDAHRPEVGQPPLTPDLPNFLRNLAAGWLALGAEG